GRGRLTQAHLVPAVRLATRRPARLEAERRPPLGRRAVRWPRRLVRGRPASGQGDDERDDAARAGQPHHTREARNVSPRAHGTKSFGSRESDARKTRTLARAWSSSARYASRAAAASPPCRTIASWMVGARPSCR